MIKVIKCAAVAGLAGVLVAGCGDKPADSNTSATNASSASPLTAPVDYLGAVGKAQQSAIKTVDIASINQAIQMFKIEHERNPRDLNELVQEKFLPRIPAAPYGMKLTYDAASGTVKVIKQ